MKHGMIDLQSEGRIGEQLLMSLPCGLLLTDAGGKVQFINDYARSILRNSTQLKLSGPGIAAVQPGNQLALLRALTGALHTRKPQYLCLGDNREERIWLLATWLGPLGQNSTGLLRLLLCTPWGELGHKAQAMRQLFGISEAEADVAIRFAAGETAPSIARERGVSIHTVRTQVRKALHKTGSERVTDLIRTVATVPFDWES